MFGLMGIKNQFRTHDLSDSWEDTLLTLESSEVIVIDSEWNGRN